MKSSDSVSTIGKSTISCARVSGTPSITRPRKATLSASAATGTLAQNQCGTGAEQPQRQVFGFHWRQYEQSFLRTAGVIVQGIAVGLRIGSVMERTVPHRETWRSAHPAQTPESNRAKGSRVLLLRLQRVSCALRNCFAPRIYNLVHDIAHQSLAIAKVVVKRVESIFRLGHYFLDRQALKVSFPEFDKRRKANFQQRCAPLQTPFSID